MLARFSFLFSIFAAAATVVSANNGGGSSGPSDAYILQVRWLLLGHRRSPQQLLAPTLTLAQYALTLEHLEDAFYRCVAASTQQH